MFSIYMRAVCIEGLRGVHALIQFLQNIYSRKIIDKNKRIQILNSRNIKLSV